MKTPALILVTTLFSAISFAQPTTSDSIPQGNGEMNGIKFKTYLDFQKSWHLVTTRYRKDSGELRFVYANDKAWEAFQSKAKSFPDGSVLGKVGFSTKEDPAFLSSIIPSGVQRYQIMEKDSSKYKETAGWGYAVFDGAGNSVHHEIGAEAKSCMACHQIVKENDYVFSKPMSYEPGDFRTPDKPARYNVQFQTLKSNQIPPAAQLRLPPKTKRVRAVVGQLKENLFLGTLDEIRPTLAKETIKSKLPSILFNNENGIFSMVYIDPTARNCSRGQSPAIDLVAVFTGVSLSNDTPKVRETKIMPFCGSIEPRESK